MKIHFTLHLITWLPKGGWRFTIWKVKLIGITNNTNKYYGADWHFTPKFCTISISLGFVSSIFLKVVKPALTIIVDNIGPKTKCIVELLAFYCKKKKFECTSITIYEFETRIVVYTNFLQLSWNKLWILPQSNKTTQTCKDSFNGLCSMQYSALISYSYACNYLALIHFARMIEFWSDRNSFSNIWSSVKPVMRWDKRFQYHKVNRTHERYWGVHTQFTKITCKNKTFSLNSNSIRSNT